MSRSNIACLMPRREANELTALRDDYEPSPSPDDYTVHPELHEDNFDSGNWYYLVRTVPSKDADVDEVRLWLGRLFTRYRQPNVLVIYRGKWAFFLCLQYPEFGDFLYKKQIIRDLRRLVKAYRVGKRGFRSFRDRVDATLLAGTPPAASQQRNGGRTNGGFDYMAHEQHMRGFKTAACPPRASTSRANGDGVAAAAAATASLRF
ncbi:hypothetical protein GGR57DRAFT_500057 [Xylariaceae sp. FL1272]|nr:hypothetical protein GGR57DRAFT_500057 [Xylariaceae sp. FL1272]